MYAAADVGGSWIRVAGPGVAAADPIRLPTPGAIGDIAGSILAAVEEAGWADLDALGVACAGLVDHTAGVLRWMPHAEGRDAQIGAVLADALGATVWLDNDANAAALAEARRGAGAGHRVVLVVTVGTGIGAGLAIAGRVERGRRHLGEVGHMRITSGVMCRCGRTGCWETVASGRALDEAARRIDPAGDGAWLISSAAAGDTAASAAVGEVAGWLAHGLENLALALDPDVIVLGGGAGPPLLHHALSRLGGGAGSLGVAGMPEVVPAAFGASASLEGAIIGAMEMLS